METYIYNKGNFVKATKWMLFKRYIKNLFYKYKLVNTNKYKLVKYEDLKYYFTLSPKEYEDAKKLYKDKGTISYEFYPLSGLGWGVKIHTKNDEIFDITDFSSI